MLCDGTSLSFDYPLVLLDVDEKGKTENPIADHSTFVLFTLLSFIFS